MRQRPLLLGHRGARREAPENTIQAFDLCLRHGCDGFEFDVRLCGDGKSVICHDARLRGRSVAKSGFEQLHAACLEDVFREFAHRAFLDIELKVPGLERMVSAMVRENPPQRGYCVSSFLPAVIDAVAKEDESLRLGLICDSRTQLSRWRELPVQAVFLHYSLCKPAVVESLRAAGKDVFVWTVNRATRMQSFTAMGVDGIISDDTGLLARTLGGDAVGGGTDKKR